MVAYANLRYLAPSQLAQTFFRQAQLLHSCRATGSAWRIEKSCAHHVAILVPGVSGMLTALRGAASVPDWWHRQYGPLQLLY